jgi:hypothetical protein
MLDMAIGGGGTMISVSSSSLASAVVERPSQKSARRIWR